MSRDDKEARLILVLEKEQETRDGIERLLKADGYRVDSARDEDDAVMRARHASPDLMLISLGGLPDDAIAEASSICERAGLGQSIPVVIFSVETVAEGAEEKIEGNVYLTRPDNFDQLRALFRRLLSQPPPTIIVEVRSSTGPENSPLRYTQALITQIKRCSTFSRGSVDRRWFAAAD
jgi:DNA-binding response OmpR family regulator